MFEREGPFVPKSPNELCDYLKSEGILTTNWGIGAAKTIDHLFKELFKEESCLLRIPEGLVRRVRAVNIRIYYQQDGKTLYLKEQKQVFSDGRERKRDWLDWSISEKMTPHEEVTIAIKRAFQEELGITDEVMCSFKETSTRVLESPSYPGLQAEYESNHFDAFLGPSQFNPDGYIEVQPDKTNYWTWERVG